MPGNQLPLRRYRRRILGWGQPGRSDVVSLDLDKSCMQGELSVDDVRSAGFTTGPVATTGSGNTSISDDDDTDRHRVAVLHVAGTTECDRLRGGAVSDADVERFADPIFGS